MIELEKRRFDVPKPNPRLPSPYPLQSPGSESSLSLLLAILAFDSPSVPVRGLLGISSPAIKLTAIFDL